MNRDLTNQILHLNHRKFSIQEVIGIGASCVVYRAVCPDNTEHLLKEYNPRHIAMYRDDNGELCLESEEDREEFEAGLARFREGHALQRRLRLDSDLKNSTSNIQEIYRANGTEYIDMTCFAGQSYEKVREKSVYDLMRRMRALAQVIGNYHKAGLLHLDIKPQNIFTIPETCELVMLFDFDSVVTKETAARGGAHSYSKGWSAPEQRNPPKRRNICEATDLFAVGEIIFWHLMGRNSTAEDHRSFATYTFEHNAPIFENVNPKVFPLLDELLHHTICAPIDQRYQGAEELITKLDAIIKIADPKEPYLKSSAMSMQDFFIGRDSEIQEIHKKLSENRILFLGGIGGIGKSELAKHYAETHKADYDAIIFASYVSDVNILITNDATIPIYNFQPYPEENHQEYYARKLRKLRELCDERILLIVDNLDSDEDPDIPKLLELGCKLLITTRMDFSDYGPGQFLYIDALRNKAEIRDIFDKYYTKPLSADEESCVERIIDLVAGHTMTVELLAKQMMAGRVKPDKMLAKLQEGGISESGSEKVRSGKDGAFATKSAYHHIQALFDLSELDENEQYILANLSLIPYSGISTELFRDWCELDSYDEINRLVAAGWVRNDDTKDFISLHPVVCDIISDTSGLETFCLTFLHRTPREIYWKRSLVYKNSWLVDVLRISLQKIINYNFSTAQTADYLRAIATVLSSFENVDFIVMCYQKALAIRLNLFGKTHGDVAISYHYLSAKCLSIGKIEEAEKYCNDALEIIKQLYGTSCKPYMESLYLLGLIYIKRKQYNIALNLIQQTKEYYECLGNKNHFRVTRCYMQIGGIYFDNRDYSNGASNFEKYISCEAEKHGLNSLPVATGYYALSVLYRESGQLQMAISYGEKALQIRQKRCGAIHASLGRSYSSLGKAYLEAGDMARAQIYLEKALNMRVKLCGEEHQETATSHYRMGALYEKLCEYQQAKSHYQRAFEIRVQLFGYNDANTLEAKAKVANMTSLLHGKVDS